MAFVSEAAAEELAKKALEQYIAERKCALGVIENLTNLHRVI